MSVKTIAACRALSDEYKLHISKTLIQFDKRTQDVNSCLQCIPEWYSYLES